MATTKKVKTVRDEWRALRDEARAAGTAVADKQVELFDAPKAEAEAIGPGWQVSEIVSIPTGQQGAEVSYAAERRSTPRDEQRAASPEGLLDSIRQAEARITSGGRKHIAV